MVLLKDGVSESGTIRDTEKGRREEGQNTILKLDIKYVISNHFKFE